MDDPKLRVQPQVHPRAVVLTVDGEVDLYSVSVLTTAALTALEQLHAAAATGEGVVAHLVVDLHSVPFMDSAGLGALVGVMRRAQGHEVAFSLVAPSPRSCTCWRSPAWQLPSPCGRTCRRRWLTAPQEAAQQPGRRRHLGERSPKEATQVIGV